jgi:outer membrane protein
MLTGWWSSFSLGIPCCRAQEKEQSQESKDSQEGKGLPNAEVRVGDPKNFRKEVEEDASRLHVGGGAMVQTEPYRGVSPRVYPAPVIAYEGEHLSVRSAIVAYRIISYNGLMIGPMVQPRVEGYSESDSPFLAGMQSRDWSVDGGVNVEAATPVGLLGLSIVTDLLGRYRGQEVEFRYLIMFPFLGFNWIPSGGVRWKSDNLVDYYYGVRPEEAQPDRPAYEGQQAFDPFLRLVIRHNVTKHWSLFSDAQYEGLASAITDSPLVDKDHQMSLTVGALYAW